MNATYSETIDLSDAELALVQNATTALEKVAGPSAGLVQAEWERGEDPKGRTLYTLRISAWEESVSATFTPGELRSPRELRWRLLTLWGDLLQERSHMLLENLTKGNDDPEV